MNNFYTVPKNKGLIMPQDLYQQRIFNIATMITSINTTVTMLDMFVYRLTGTVQSLHDVQQILVSIGIEPQYIKFKKYHNDNYGELNVLYRTGAWGQPKNTIFPHVHILRHISQQFKRLDTLKWLHNNGGVNMNALEMQYINRLKSR